MFGALRHRPFRLFFLGQLVSLTGTWMQSTAQAWLVYRLTGDPVMLGLTALATQFPVFLFGLRAGLAVDRVNRLALVRATQFLSMAQAAALTALTASGRVEVWHVLALAFLLGTVNAVDVPARQVLLGELVPVEDRHKAIALNSFAVNVCRVMGPALAGMAIGLIGESGCFALNAASFLAVLVALAAVPPTPAPGKAEGEASAWREIGDGLAYAFRSGPIRLVLFGLTGFSLLGLPVWVLLPVLADRVFDSGAKGFGVLSSVSGIGAALSALDLARRPAAAGLGRQLELSLYLFAAALAGLALSDAFWLSGLLMGVAGWGALRMIAGSNTALQELSDDRHRGRVIGFYSMIFIGLSPVGSFAAGALAAALGVRGAMALESAAVAALALTLGGRLRRVL